MTACCMAPSDAHSGCADVGGALQIRRFERFNLGEQIPEMASAVAEQGEAQQ